MQRLKIDETVLVLVDVQEKLMPVIDHADAVIQRCQVLVKAANVLQIPLIVTEQYPLMLGATVSSINDELQDITPISKKSFSACTAEMSQSLKAVSQRRSVLLCGVEAHVCVLQTALDLIDQQYDVFVVRDAISSRASVDCETGWERMMRAGAIPVSVESALFELLQTADRPEFKAVHRLIK